MRGLMLLSLVVVAGACATGKPAAVATLTEGEAKLAVPGGNIWYKVTGAGTALPVVLLHGGPGFSSFYLKALEALGDDRQVIRYDQLGSGKSDRITDTTMFTFGHFIAELDSLRSALGLAKWHVAGHSWGSMLALEYYRAHPDRVASLTLQSTVVDVPAFAARAKELLRTLPDSLQQAVIKSEAAGKFDDPGYQAAMNAFYGLYVWRRPVQADLDSTFATVNQGIYTYMQGPSEFTITGTFKDYNARSFLRQVTVPTLFTAGEFDEVGPALVRGYADSVTGAHYALISGAAHITMWDAPAENLRVVREFLRAADSSAAGKKP